MWGKLREEMKWDAYDDARGRYEAIHGDFNATNSKEPRNNRFFKSSRSPKSPPTLLSQSQ